MNFSANFSTIRDVEISRETPSAPCIAIVLPGIGAGGTEHVVNVLANHWVAKGWRVAILTLDASDAVSYYPLDPRVGLYRLGLPPNKSASARALWTTVRRVHSIRKALRSLRPNAVISFLTRTNVLTLIAGLGLGIPVVVSERNNPQLQAFGPIWNTLRKRLYPRAFGLVTMTRGSLECFPPSMRSRSWVIPNPVNLPTSWHMRRGTRTLAAVGRLTPQKGFDLLLEAFARISARVPDWKLVIWGEGPERRNLESLRNKLGLAARVEFPGLTPKPVAWIETADAFVLSSRYEGWGIVLLEAMAAGLPVVSFDCKWGPQEMVRNGEDGILVPPENVGELSKALEMLLTDDALRQRLANAARKATERFDREHVMAQWDEVAHEAIRASSVQPTLTNVVVVPLM